MQGDQMNYRNNDDTKGGSVVKEKHLQFLPTSSISSEYYIALLSNQDPPVT